MDGRECCGSGCTFVDHDQLSLTARIPVELSNSLLERGLEMPAECANVIVRNTCSTDQLLEKRGLH